MATATATLTGEQLGAYLTQALESDVLEVEVTYGLARVTVRPEALPRAARLCKSDPRLRFDFFDWMSGVDLREEGFAVVTSLYSIPHRHHIHLRVVAPGGRDNPSVPTLTGIYRGANWHEREVYDMYGVTFEGHPGLLPRILTVENFEGWPLRKDFLLSSREAKPWPGAKEPEERKDEPGPAQSEAVIANAEPLSAAEKSATAAAVAETAEPQREEVEYDQALYEQLLAEGKSERIARSRAKAAAMRARKTTAGETEGAAAAQVRAQEGAPTPSTPEGAAEIAADELSDPSVQKDAAAGAVGGDVAEGAPGDQPGVDQPVDDLAAEARVGTGAPPVPGGSPGAEAEGRRAGAVEQSGAKPAAETPGMTASPEGTPERGQGGAVPNETPAPGPESNTPSDEETSPETLRGDMPVTPAPGSDAAPMPSDQQVDDASRVTETPLVHEDDTEPAPAPGTDATDRGGPLYGARGSDPEPDDDQPRNP